MISHDYKPYIKTRSLNTVHVKLNKGKGCSLKAPVHRRVSVFQKLFWKNKFATICYEADLYISMDWYLYESFSVVKNWPGIHCTVVVVFCLLLFVLGGVGGGDQMTLYVRESLIHSREWPHIFWMCFYPFRSTLCQNNSVCDPIGKFLHHNVVKTKCCLLKLTCAYKFVPVNDIYFWKSKIFTITKFHIPLLPVNKYLHVNNSYLFKPVI